ncbi:DNA methyltransferase [Photorhabdus sp. SF281]|uniref:DNA methyltransferase n=1 Tax=Photorhabdus sp. SF281 TaxID=3459527 RepID=UPI0040443B39
MLDPFIGSGTTLGEAAKLGASIIGCDVNPHPGELSFSATVLAHGITRHKQVSYLFNDTDFTVAFHIVFTNAEKHNEYQISKAHVDKFIPMSNPNWEKIRVFDSEIQ